MPILQEKWFSTFVSKIPELEDKVIAITGTTSGLGFWVAIAAIRLKARKVFLLNRPSERVDASIEKLEEEKINHESNTVLNRIDCDLKLFESVRTAANEIIEIISVEDLGGLDILINNAGIAKGTDITEDGYLSCSQVNHLSHFLLTASLFDVIGEAATTRGEARIVNHSSGARYLQTWQEKHYKMINEEDAKTVKHLQLYSCTKIANCLFSLELHRNLKENNILSVIADPGLAREKTSGVFSFLYPTQSYADGSLSIIKAAFGKGVNSGDFFCPGGYLYLRGKPILALKAGKPTWNIYGEKNIIDEVAAKKLWEVSEEAIGQKFSL